jgi:hypothetical protein
MCIKDRINTGYEGSLKPTSLLPLALLRNRTSQEETKETTSGHEMSCFCDFQIWEHDREVVNVFGRQIEAMYTYQGI